MPDLSHLFKETAAIERAQHSDMQEGRPSAGYEKIGEARCRLRPAGSKEVSISAQKKVEVTDVVYMPGDTDVKEGDRLQVIGLTLDVIFPRNPAYANHHLEVLCRRLSP